jgi:FAD/FMN-containing dehydrogenase
LTGVVSGAVSSEDDVIVSLERMNAIEEVDELDGVAVVQAGAILQNVQEALAEQGFLFPLDFGARGSCMIGGCIATNAGGINVLRYGMTRQNLLGVEAVLADGTIVSSMNQMLKNNTGYDLKQLFVGSEGTLGIVTRAVFKLFPLPTSRQTAMLATDSFDAVTRLLRTMHSDLAGTLSAFEVMWDRYVAGVTKPGGHVSPFDQHYPFYILAEAEGSDAVADQQRFEALLERGFEAGDIVDAVIPKSDSERTTLWNIREEFDPLLPAYLYDVSMPMKAMVPYVERIEERLREWHDDAECYVFGHIADGNLHIFVKPYDDGVHHAACDRIIYESLDGFSGSISAEHGIGIEKREWLGKSRSEDEMRIMRQIKATLDPKGLLNPGRVI